MDPAEGTVRRMRKELDSWLSWRHGHMTGNEKLIALVALVQQWRDSLEPRELVDRVKDLTSREYWEHFRETRRSGKEISYEEAARETDAIYRAVAEELLKDLQTFAGLREWLGSSDNKSGHALAHAIARLDREGTTNAIVGPWIVAGTALSTCAGYLRGLGTERGQLNIINAALEQLANTQPGAALRLTADGDFSESGFERIIQCLKQCKADDLWSLRSLITNSWQDLLTEERVLVLANELRRLQQSPGYHEVASAVALDILHLMFSQNAVRDPALAATILSILSDATDESKRDNWDWVQLARAVQSHDPKTVCWLAVNHLVKSRSDLDDSLGELVTDCARESPGETMAALASVFADKEKRWIFRALVFHGLFDAIGVPAVSRYLQDHPEFAPFIARHLEGPSISESGELQVPSLADWVMNRFGEDSEVWSEFMMGRHSLEVFAIPEGYETAKAKATPFLDHAIAWVRKWAAAEVLEMDREIKEHERDEDRRERE